MEDRSLLQAIGQMLEPLTARLDSLEGKLASGIAGLEQGQQEIREDVQALKADNAKLILHEKKMDLLLEGQREIRDQFGKLDALASDMEDVKISIGALKAVTRSNSDTIKNSRIICSPCRKK